MYVRKTPELSTHKSYVVAKGGRDQPKSMRSQCSSV